MAELRDLYQEVILEHTKAPRNYRELGEPAAKAEGYNPCAATAAPCSSTRKTASSRTLLSGPGCAISKARPR